MTRERLLQVVRGPIITSFSHVHCCPLSASETLWHLSICQRSECATPEDRDATRTGLKVAHVAKTPFDMCLFFPLLFPNESSSSATLSLDHTNNIPSASVITIGGSTPASL